MLWLSGRRSRLITSHDQLCCLKTSPRVRVSRAVKASWHLGAEDSRPVFSFPQLLQGRRPLSGRTVARSHSLPSQLAMAEGAGSGCPRRKPRLQFGCAPEHYAGTVRVGDLSDRSRRSGGHLLSLYCGGLVEGDRVSRACAVGDLAKSLERMVGGRCDYRPRRTLNHIWLHWGEIRRWSMRPELPCPGCRVINCSCRRADCATQSESGWHRVHCGRLTTNVNGLIEPAARQPSPG